MLFRSIASLGGPAAEVILPGLYHSYDEMLTELRKLETDHPDIAKVYDIGDAWEKSVGIANRDIIAIKISDNVAEEEDEPETLFLGCHHAREWIAVEVPLGLAIYLVTNYDTDPQVKSYVDNGQIWIVPMVNPDGHEYSVTTNRLWRKNRRNNGGGTFGVDLNRNYGYGWGGPGSSPLPSSDIYHGTGPFSEPETQAIRALFLTHDFKIMITYHSYSQLILYPWGNTFAPAAHEPGLASMAWKMSNLIQAVNNKFYQPEPGSSLYITSGTTDDWTYSKGVFSYTIELRPVGAPGFVLPENEIIPTFLENLPAALYLIAWTQDGIVDNAQTEFTVTPDVIPEVWKRSVSPNSNFYGPNFRWKDPGTGTAKAVWEPELVTGAGNYEVSIWYPIDSLFATNAPFTINHAGVSDTVIVDQSVDGGKWVSLGTYYFENNDTENITLSDNADSWVAADAVRFIIIDDTTPPVITNVQSTATGDSAVITWDTDEPSDSLVMYGTVQNDYLYSEGNTDLVTSHSILLTGLAPSTTYYYIVSSADAIGNSADSSEYSFTTTTSSYVVGDLDGDGEIHVNDALMYLRYVVKLPINNVNPVDDVTCDGEIHIDDAVLVLRKTVDPDVNLVCP